MNHIKIIQVTTSRIKNYYRNCIKNHIYNNVAWDYYLYIEGEKVLGFLIINPIDELSGGSLIYDIGFKSSAIMVSLIKRATCDHKKINFLLTMSIPILMTSLILVLVLNTKPHFY